MRFILALILASASSAAAGDTDAELAAYDVLREGGNVLVMRHAHSPHDQLAPVGMSEGCRLGDGRGLDPLGFYQARALGEVLRAEGAPVLKAYTSRMCRAWDTARLVAGGAPVEPTDAQMTTNADDVAAFKAAIETEIAANPARNIILSSHSNIAPLYGADAKADEEEIPSGAIFVVKPRDWRTVYRITIDVSDAAASVRVE